MEQTPIDRIVAEMAAGPHLEEVKRAREQFFRHLRDLREDDLSYERLTSCFLNWYVFDRRMDSGAGTPLQVYAGRPALSASERASCAALAANVHSLFEVRSIGEGGVVLLDLFDAEELRVHERRQLAGLQRGDVLEARLVPLADRLVFAPGAFVLHPRAARRLVVQAVGRARTLGRPPPEELITRLQALNFRYLDRFRERVPVEKVYAEILSFTSGEPQKLVSGP